MAFTDDCWSDNGQEIDFKILTIFVPRLTTHIQTVLLLSFKLPQDELPSSSSFNKSFTQCKNNLLFFTGTLHNKRVYKYKTSTVTRDNNTCIEAYGKFFKGIIFWPKLGVWP